MATEIRPTEHVFIPGRTGSGKTFLARNYLAGYPRVIALDTKGTLSWPECPAADQLLITHLEELPEALRQKNKIIYRPAFEELNRPFYEEFYKYCYLLGECIVWTDEVMQVCPNPQTIPQYFSGIMTRGRELGVAAWNLTQRPATIPLVTMSEATHIFCFDLNMKEDRRRVVEVTEHEEFYTKPGFQVFWYYNMAGDDRPYRGKLVVK